MMTDDEKFEFIRDIESLLLPNIHRLGIFYLSDVLHKISGLEVKNRAVRADGAEEYQDALDDVRTIINLIIDRLVRG